MSIRSSSKTNLPLRLLIVFMIGIFVWTVPSSAQTEGQNKEILNLQHVKKEKQSFGISEGTKVKVKTLSGEKIKGILTGVRGDSILIDSMPIALDQIEVIRLKGLGKVGAKISGYILGGIGLAGIIIGGLFGFIGWRTNNQPTTSSSQGCGQALAVAIFLVLAILFAAAGLVFLAFGLGAFLIGYLGGRSFKLRKKWRLNKK